MVCNISAAGGPVHWLENVDGDPRLVRTGCGRFQWAAQEGAPPLDPERPVINEVTCVGCLEAMRKAKEAGTVNPPPDAYCQCCKRLSDCCICHKNNAIYYGEQCKKCKPLTSLVETEMERRASIVPSASFLPAMTKMVQQPDGKWREALPGEQHQAVLVHDVDLNNIEPPIMVSMRKMT